MVVVTFYSSVWRRNGPVISLSVVVLVLTSAFHDVGSLCSGALFHTFSTLMLCSSFLSSFGFVSPFFIVSPTALSVFRCMLSMIVLLSCVFVSLSSYHSASSSLNFYATSSLKKKKKSAVFFFTITSLISARSTITVICKFLHLFLLASLFLTASHQLTEEDAHTTRRTCPKRYSYAIH